MSWALFSIRTGASFNGPPPSPAHIPGDHGYVNQPWRTQERHTYPGARDFRAR